MTQQQHIRIDHPPAPAPKRRPWLPWAAAAGLVLLLTAAALVGMLVVKPALTKPGNDTPPPAFTVTGTLTLRLGQFTWDRDPDRCSGWRGYDDIRAGTPVVVTDPAGTTIAVGALDPGVPRRDPANTSRATECRFTFGVTGVPGSHRFYGVQVGRRGKLDYTRDSIGRPLGLTFG